MARLFRLIGIVLIIGTYFSAAPFGYAAFALLQLVPARDEEARARLLQHIMARAFGLMHDVLRIFGIMDYDHRALRGSFPEGPCVIVANHPTLTDTSAILAALDDVTNAVRPDVFESFWAKPLLVQAAQFAGPGDDPTSLSRVMDDALDRLRRGYRVLMFPEGTRSPREGGMHRFGRAAFEIAVRANVPVVPVAIECNPRWLSKDSSFFTPPKEVPRLRLRALKPVRPEEAGACSRTLRNMVIGAIRSELDEGAAVESPSTQAS